jgi:hypothetical protein
VAPIPAVFLIIGLHLPVTYVIGIGAGHVAAWSRVNRWAVASVEESAPPPGIPGRAPYLPAWRHGVAVVIALTVGLLSLFCWFDHDIEGRRQAAEAWGSRVQALQFEDAQQRAVLETPLPTLDVDPEIISLHNTLDQARKDYPKVRDDVVCEADGTCGSRKEGFRENYEEKVRRRDQLKADIDVNLPGAIDRRTAEIQVDIDAAERAKKDAESRREEISRILSAPPVWSDRWDALNEIAAPRWKVALAVALVAGLVQFGLDVLPLQLTARRICSRRPDAEDAEDRPNARDAAGEKSGGDSDRDAEPADASPIDGRQYQYSFQAGTHVPVTAEPQARPWWSWWKAKR